MRSSVITTKDGTQIYYKDWGSGQPIVFHHGWPLSADDWDAQMMFFLLQGYRVIAHDRRGHGRSSQTANGNEMDTYAADVAELVAHLDLKNAVHIGHSTGGDSTTHLERGRCAIDPHQAVALPRERTVACRGNATPQHSQHGENDPQT